MAGEAKPSEMQLRSSIAKIINNGDLSQLTSKIVRTELEENFGVSLRTRRKEVDALIMETINKQQQSTTEAEEEDSDLDDDSEEEIKEEVSGGIAPPTQQRQVQQKPHSSAVSLDNGKDDDDSDDFSDVNLHNDEQLARKLQEDEQGSRRRSRKVKKKRKTKKPLKKKEPGQLKEGSGPRQFTGTPMVLSPELAEVVGTERMCRTEVVKTMWSIVKERKLEDPKNKRYCLCDEQLQKVFGRKKILTFGMMKYLKKHMTPPESLA